MSEPRLFISNTGRVTLKLDAKRKRYLGDIVASARGRYFRGSIRKKSKHLHRKSNSWGLNNELLTRLQEMKVENIMWFDTEQNKTYVSTLEDWIKKGEYLHFKGFELQRFLNDKHFKKY